MPTMKESRVGLSFQAPADLWSQICELYPNTSVSDVCRMGLEALVEAARKGE